MNKNIAIYMDHALAQLMQPSDEGIITTYIESEFTHAEKEETLLKGEKTMHNKEQHEQASYYQQIANAIKGCDAILLFGPTEAKTELHNILAKMKDFDKAKIKVKTSDKMTENQKLAFVKKYLSTLARQVTHIN